LPRLRRRRRGVSRTRRIARPRLAGCPAEHFRDYPLGPGLRPRTGVEFSNASRDKTLKGYTIKSKNCVRNCYCSHLFVCFYDGQSIYQPG
jgi:hypothetical protein